MNATQVKELGEQIVYTYPLMKVIILISLFVVVALAIGAVTGLLLERVSVSKFSSLEDIIGVLGVAAFFFTIYYGFIGYFHLVDEANSEYVEAVEEWEEEVLKPYIESLPVERKEIASIKMDPANTGYKTIYKSDNIQVNEKEFAHLLIVYEDEAELVEEARNFEIKRTLTDKEKPYIEFKSVKESLGHGNHITKFETLVYLPESYQLEGVVQ